MIDCANDGEKRDARHAPFCEEHADHDCGNTTATGTEPERQAAVSLGKGRRLEEVDEEEDDEDELRAAGEEAQRQRDLAGCRDAFAGKKGGQKRQSEKGQPKGGRVTFEDDDSQGRDRPQQAPDRSDATAAGVPAVRKATLEYSETIEQREQNLL